MKLSELLELNYSKRKGNKITIDDVYGIIYRIYCVSEDKSYIGQTYSHKYCGKYLQRHGIIKRIHKHWKEKDNEQTSNRPLYRAFATYPILDFEVYEEEKIYTTNLGRINSIEGEYIQKYNCLYPYGYNIEKIGKLNTMLLRTLSEYYHFDIEKIENEDNNRSKRCKDVCVGTYFGFPKQHLGLDKTLDLLKSVDIEKIRLVNSHGLRILVKVKNEPINIRVYFPENKEECLSYATQLSNNIEIAESFRDDECYKYQCKIEKILDDSKNITTIRGQTYTNNIRKCQTYLLVFYGNKKGKNQAVHRISFGGSSYTIKESYTRAMEFIDKLINNDLTDHFEYILNEPNIVD